MLFRCLLFFLILFSLYVLADGEKNCSGSFQHAEGVSHESNSSVKQSPAKGPKRATSHLSSSELLAILNNPSSSVAEREAAVQQAFFLKEARGIVVLERALDDASVEVRKAAIEVAGNMGEVALNVLNKALSDSSPEVQKELMRLMAIMSDRLIERLVAQEGLQITLKSTK